jgi:hypothetical protein
MADPETPPPPRVGLPAPDTVIDLNMVPTEVSLVGGATLACVARARDQARRAPPRSRRARRRPSEPSRSRGVESAVGTGRARG